MKKDFWLPADVLLLPISLGLMGEATNNVRTNKTQDKFYQIHGGNVI
jgi:hypothetical protein